MDQTLNTAALAMLSTGFDLPVTRIIEMLDLELFEDCLTVLQMDYAPYQEVHRYFENGGAMFEHLAKAWAIRDYTKPRTNR